jgi:hypothetical protein
VKAITLVDLECDAEVYSYRLAVYAYGEDCAVDLKGRGTQPHDKKLAVCTTIHLGCGYTAHNIEVEVSIQPWVAIVFQKSEMRRQAQ